MDGVAAVVYHNVYVFTTMCAMLSSCAGASVYCLVSRYKVPLSCYQNTTPKYGKFELCAVRLAWGIQTVRT